jgi:hypothetical protein
VEEPKMILNDLCEIKTNFADADFWIVRRGTKESLGKPSREFSPEKIGIKVVATELLDANYLFYMFQYLHSTGIFEKMGTGALRLVNIRTEDIKRIPIGS